MTLTNLTAEQITALDNLGGGFPPTPQLGDLLDDMIKEPGNPAYASVTSQTFFVRVGGNDTTGDGLTEATAWRQPQRALDEIPDGAIGYFEIDCGPGSFETPIFRRQPPGDGFALQIEVFGDRSAPDITVGTALTWAAVDSARRQANVGAYAATVTTTSHWVEFEGFLPTFPGNHCPTLNSTTPNIDIPYELDSADVVVAIHPFATTFTDQPTNQAFSSIVGGSLFYKADGFDRPIFYSGIVFDSTGSAGFQQASFYGCKFEDNTNFSDCVVQSVLNGNSTFTGTSRLQRATILKDTKWRASLNVAGVAVIGGGVDIDIGGSPAGRRPQIKLGEMDFDGCAGINAVSADVVVSGDVTCLNGPARFGLFDLGTVLDVASGVVSGTTTGVCVDVHNGSKAFGIEAAAWTVTNSGTPGDEVQTGANAAATTVVGLPKTDFVLGDTSEGCIAT